MGRYSVELKIEVIEEWKKRKLTIAEIISKYNVSSQTVRRWVEEYDSKGFEGLVANPKNKVYTGEFKQTVVEDMRKNNLSNLKYLVNIQLAEAKYSNGSVYTLSKGKRDYMLKSVVALLDQ